MKFRDYVELISPNAWVTSGVSVTIGALLTSKIFNYSMFLDTLGAIIIIGPLLWGGLYTLNAIYDIKFDSLHPQKKLRPLPQKRVSMGEAWVIACIHIIFALALSAMYYIKIVPILLIMIILQIIYCVPPVRVKERHIGPLFSGPLNHLLRLIAGYTVNLGSISGFPWLIAVGLTAYCFPLYLTHRHANNYVYKKMNPNLVSDKNEKILFLKYSLMVFISNIIVFLSIFMENVNRKFVYAPLLMDVVWIYLFFEIAHMKGCDEKKYSMANNRLSSVGWIAIIVFIIILFW